MNGIQAVITQENAKITCNFKQVEKAIQDKLAEYEGIVFTEDSKASARKEVASLRAEKKSLQDNMRDAKTQYMKPWENFEAQANKLIGLYDEPIDLINGQIQAFEKKRIAEKKQLIQKIYKCVPEDLQVYISLERIYNPKWENATYKEKDIKADIAEFVHKTENDLNTITSMQSEAVEKALNIYKDSLSLTDAITYINNYEQQKQQILAREQEKQRQEEAEKIRREEREKMLAEQRAREAKEAALRQAKAEKEEALRQAEAERIAAVEQAREDAVQEVIESFIPNMEGEENLYEYRISLSDDAKEKLEMYMDSVGIEWEMIE
jgi:hypothetical protein